MCLKALMSFPSLVAISIRFRQEGKSMGEKLGSKPRGVDPKVSLL